MPRLWHDRHAVNKIEDDSEKQFQRRIVADKKPRFMIYIYPDLMRQYNTYLKNTQRTALREFQMTPDELKAMPYQHLTDRQKEFLYHYDIHMPVGVGPCTMNKICKIFEGRFDGFVGKRTSPEDFDYTILKSGGTYKPAHKSAIQKCYDEYQSRLKSYAMFSHYERIDDDEVSATVYGMREEFKRACESICQNEEELCDILLDICYKKASTKKVVWSLYADVIVNNLLRKNGNKMSAPVQDPDGDIQYCGYRFSIITKEVDAQDEYSPERMRMGEESTCE